MIEGIEELYQLIAESIQDAIPEEWSTAKMEAIFYSDSSTYFGEYTRETDGLSRDFATPRISQRAFRALRTKFKEAGKTPWGRACFELHADGRFNMKWGYDDCDENGDTRFDEEEEIRLHEDRRRRLT